MMRPLSFDEALMVVTTRHTAAGKAGVVVEQDVRRDALLVAAWKVIRERQGMACVTAL